MGLLQSYVRHRSRHGQTRLSDLTAASTPKAIEVTTPIQAAAAINAAAALRVPVMLLSAEGAAAYAGPSWFAHLIDDAQARFPDVSVVRVLDCGDQPGLAMAALRDGFSTVRFDGPAFDKIADIATQLNAQALQRRPAILTLDNLRQDETILYTACEEWLQE
jgi:hypothetical protein